MFSYLNYRLRYGSYLRHEHGIKKFAEMSMGQLIRRVTKKSAFYREMNENLLVEKANLRMRSEELYEKAMLDPGDFFSIRRRHWANAIIIATVVVTAVVLNYISVSAFLQDETTMASVLVWFLSGLLALVLTGGGLLASERLIESLLSKDLPRMQRLSDANTGAAVLWALMLVGVEVAILGIAEVRASQLGASQGSALLFFGFITLSMMLPIIAGALRWDAMRFIDVYKTTMAHRQIEGRLAQIDSILRQNEEFESNFYKLRSITAWEQVNEFKTYKDNYNQRRDIVENLSGHFAQTYDTFQAEANKRYTADIRDITAKSMRKLELVETLKPAGSKLGQQNGPSTDRPPMGPRPASSDQGTGVDESDVYLSPKPIR